MSDPEMPPPDPYDDNLDEHADILRKALGEGAYAEAEAKFWEAFLRKDYDTAWLWLRIMGRLG